MPSALFVSPHLDDVAFSCGGALNRLARAGWGTVLCTVFTRTVPEPKGFALACQTDKGIAPDVDYMALRRAEDAEAARLLGAADVLLLDLPEAPHRGYESAAALFGEPSPRDAIGPELEAALMPLLGRYDVVFAPQGIGSHIDHRHVRDVVLARGGGPVAWYRDAPYAIRHPEAVPEGSIAELPEHAIALDEAAVAAKLDACAAYASQLGFQFGGEAAMREALAGYAEAVRAPADVMGKLILR